MFKNVFIKVTSNVGDRVMTVGIVMTVDYRLPN
jgi:hypothetical protein